MNMIPCIFICYVKSMSPLAAPIEKYSRSFNTATLEYLGTRSWKKHVEALTRDLSPPS